MNIHLQHQARTVDCRNCGDPIRIGEQSIRQSYHNFAGKSRMRFYHLACFLQYMMQWYVENPFAPTPRGRRAMVIPEGLRQERANIIASYSYNMKRKRELISGGEFEKAEMLDSKFDILKERIKGVGGVPKSWN